MHIPMREKYVDEAVGLWTVFGHHADGSVDVNDGLKDVFVGLPRPVAEHICELQECFRNGLYAMLCDPESYPKRNDDGPTNTAGNDASNDRRSRGLC